MRLLELHEKGALSKADPWEPAIDALLHVPEILQVLLKDRQWSAAHIQFGLRICYAVMDLHTHRVTDLRDLTIKAVNAFCDAEGKGMPLYSTCMPGEVLHTSALSTPYLIMTPSTQSPLQPRPPRLYEVA